MSYIVKPDKDVDLYIVMSSVSDTPLFWGTREALIEMAQDPANREYLGAPQHFEPKLVRADTYSCSTMHDVWSWDEDETILWAGHGFIYRSELITVMGVASQCDWDFYHPLVVAMCHQEDFPEDDEDDG